MVELLPQSQLRLSILGMVLHNLDVSQKSIEEVLEVSETLYNFVIKNGEQNNNVA